MVLVECKITRAGNRVEPGYRPSSTVHNPIIHTIKGAPYVVIKFYR